VNRDELAGVAARMALGLIGPGDLLSAADAALDGGLDSPALIALAAADTNEARALFERAWRELTVSQPSRREAVTHLAHDAAAKIVGGTLAPYTGAKRT
jgi:hypothetical protein